MARPLVVLALLTLGTTVGCFRARWEGTQGLSRSVGTGSGAVISAAERALRVEGYNPEVVDSTQLVTMPRDVPTVEGDTTTRSASGRAWVLQVIALPEGVTEGGRSRITVSAYLVPQSGTGPMDPSGRLSVRVTEQMEPALYREVRRLGDRILAEVGRDAR